MCAARIFVAEIVITRTRLRRSPEADDFGDVLIAAVSLLLLSANGKRKEAGS